MAAKDKAAKQGKASAEDLIGDTSKRSKAALAGKGSGSGAAKGAAGAKGQGRQGAGALQAAGGKKVKASSIGERGAKAKAAAQAERAATGEGKYYFPADHADRAKIQKLIEKNVKGEAVSTKDFATKHGLETWQVRLVARSMADNKQLKLTKSGDTGGVLLMQAGKGK